MSTSTDTGVQGRTLSAFFATAEAARTAVDDLVADGITRQNIMLTSADDPGVQRVERDHSGFWAKLKDLFLPDDDRHAYAEGLRRGGQLVTVRADAADMARVSAILDAASAVDIDAQADQRQSDGWLSGVGHAGPVVDVSGPTSGIIAGTGPLDGLRSPGATRATEAFAGAAYDRSRAATPGSANAAMSRAEGLTESD